MSEIKTGTTVTSIGWGVMRATVQFRTNARYSHTPDPDGPFACVRFASRRMPEWFKVETLKFVEDCAGAGVKERDED